MISLRSLLTLVATLVMVAAGVGQAAATDMRKHDAKKSAKTVSAHHAAHTRKARVHHHRTIVMKNVTVMRPVLVRKPVTVDRHVLVRKPVTVERTVLVRKPVKVKTRHGEHMRYTLARETRKVLQESYPTSPWTKKQAAAAGT